MVKKMKSWRKQLHTPQCRSLSICWKTLFSTLVRMSRLVKWCRRPLTLNRISGDESTTMTVASPNAILLGSPKGASPGCFLCLLATILLSRHDQKRERSTQRKRRWSLDWRSRNCAGRQTQFYSTRFNTYDWNGKRFATSLLLLCKNKIKQLKRKKKKSPLDQTLKWFDQGGFFALRGFRFRFVIINGNQGGNWATEN